MNELEIRIESLEELTKRQLEMIKEKESEIRRLTNELNKKTW